MPDDDENDAAWLHDPDGVGPALFLQRVPEPKQGKVRLHMDVRVAGGAVLTTELHRFVVMKDPEGHEFCVG
ncbi:VOC family protein [Amycolatopsis sp. cg5]|uniref:VOC family protein n=1 Tax=Amycolatopsis sp. cg5 TaxID=3238802 RepID=UPI0035256C61